jgi:hypothetical protein
LRQGLDLPPLDCSGHPSAGPEGIEMLRDGGPLPRWASSPMRARSGGMKPIAFERRNES